MPYIHNMPLTNRRQCSKSNVQLCSWCAETDCCDNTTPAEAIEIARKYWETIDMVAYFLATRGYDGLYNPALGCACQLCDLAPCDEMTQYCEAAYRFDCARCSKRPSCSLADEEQPWLMSASKDFCEPDYTVAEPAAAYAAENAALPALAPLTVDEVLRSAWPLVCYAQGGIGEASEDAWMVEPGEIILPLSSLPVLTPQQIAEMYGHGGATAEKVCQNTAKNEAGGTISQEVETAVRAVRNAFLQLGA